MSLVAKSPSGFSPIGAPSSPESDRSAVIVSREFSAARPLPLPDTVSLDSLMERFEADPRKAAALQEARERLASAFYAEHSDTLAALRMRKGFSQAQLAQQVGTSQSHIARIERGRNDPATDLIGRIAAALGVDAAEVFDSIVKQRAYSRSE